MSRKESEVNEQKIEEKRENERERGGDGKTEKTEKKSQGSCRD